MIGIRDRLTTGMALAAVLALAACSERTETAAPEATPAEESVIPKIQTPPAPTVAPDGETIGGDGSAIRLGALTEADMKSADLPGELACAFGTEAASPPLLIAKGDVGSREPAQGVVKVSESVERVATPGGFDGMLKGATFSGAGKVIRIKPSGPATGGGESPPQPATLTFERADGASRTIDGFWTCGP